MTTLYLIRHGETVWNAERRIQGHQNSALNVLGHAQAHAAATALAMQSLAAVYTSDLGRAEETARIIAAPHHLSSIADPRLREVYFGAWEGYTIDEISGRWPDLYAAWRNNALETRPPDGETLEQIQLRVEAFVNDIVPQYPDHQIAIVGHGGSLRAIVAMALSADLAIFRHFHIDHGAISVVQWHDGRSSLLRLNEDCHLRRLSLPGSPDETDIQQHNVEQPE